MFVGMCTLLFTFKASRAKMVEFQKAQKKQVLYVHTDVHAVKVHFSNFNLRAEIVKTATNCKKIKFVQTTKVI